jgi:hypothetical protein
VSPLIWFWLYGPIGAGALSVKLLFHLSHLWFKYILLYNKTVFVLPDGVEASFIKLNVAQYA